MMNILWMPTAAIVIFDKQTLPCILVLLAMSCSGGSPQGGLYVVVTLFT
jgi:hypothetical protein